MKSKMTYLKLKKNIIFYTKKKKYYKYFIITLKNINL